MKVIYVAGKYSAISEWDLEENIHHAATIARRLWLQGWATICPHMNTAHFGGYRQNGSDAFKNMWREGDLELVRRCDAIYMLEGWEQSEGAKQELELAKELNLDVFYEENKNELQGKC